jgi:hypothetical protein
VAEAVGIVHVLASGQPPEHRLAELGKQGVAAVASRSDIGQRLAGHRGQAESLVEFAEGHQPGVGGDARAAELQLQSAVESNLKVIFRRSCLNFSVLYRLSLSHCIHISHNLSRPGPAIWKIWVGTTVTIVSPSVSLVANTMAKEDPSRLPLDLGRGLIARGKRSRSPTLDEAWGSAR